MFGDHKSSRCLELQAPIVCAHSQQNQQVSRKRLGRKIREYRRWTDMNACFNLYRYLLCGIKLSIHYDVFFSSLEAKQNQLLRSCSEDGNKEMQHPTWSDCLRESPSYFLSSYKQNRELWNYKKDFPQYWEPWCLLDFTVCLNQGQQLLAFQWTYLKQLNRITSYNIQFSLLLHVTNILYWAS